MTSRAFESAIYLVVGLSPADARLEAFVSVNYSLGATFGYERLGPIGGYMGVVALKPYKDVLEGDAWWDGLVMWDGKEFRRRKLEDHHSFIENLRVGDHVPEGIRQQFENARNAYLYAFFAHRLLMVAELQAYVTVEFALREKAIASGRKIPEWWGMGRLFALAIRNKWIVDAGFRVHQRNEEMRRERLQLYAELDRSIRYEPPAADAQAYCRILAESCSFLRNMHAHGTDSIHPTVLGTFEMATDVIHQLFPAPAITPVAQESGEMDSLG